MSDTTEDELKEGREQTAEVPQELPGRRLQQAREAAGVSRSEMAAQMRINERMIAALEEDDYDTLPSATYVTGYVRSYVRILGLPEADFVKPLHSTASQPALVTSIGSNEQVSSRALPVRLVTYLLVAVAVISVVMWWYAKRDKPEIFTAGPQNEVAEMADARQWSGDDSGEPLLQNETPPSSLARGVDDTAAESPLTDSDNGMPGAAELNAAETDAEPAPVQEPESEPVQSSAPTAPADGGEEASPITASTPVSQLELRFEADSWTEVQDSAGRSLAYGLIKEGRTLQLTGEAPFRVFLGYAPGVGVYYNGDRFDHSPFQRRDIARFRVGSVEHNHPGSR